MKPITLALAVGLSLSRGPDALGADVSFIPGGKLQSHPTGVILYDGEVMPEDLAAVKALMAANPKCKTIAINSPGGTFVTGIRLADLIKKNGYNTEAWGKGAWSAAAFMFWNGRRTDIYEGSKVGFHFPFVDGSKEAAPQAYHGMAGASIYAGAPDMEGVAGLLLNMQQAYDAFGNDGYFVIFPDEDGKFTSGFLNPKVSDRLYTSEEVKEIANERQNLQER